GLRRGGRERRCLISVPLGPTTTHERLATEGPPGGDRLFVSRRRPPWRFGLPYARRRCLAPSGWARGSSHLPRACRRASHRATRRRTRRATASTTSATAASRST